MITNRGIGDFKAIILKYEGLVALDEIAASGEVDMPNKSSRNVENFFLAKKKNWNLGIMNLGNLKEH